MTDFDVPITTVSTFIVNNAAFRREREAVVRGTERVSWGEFNARVNRMAHALLGLGLRKGDKVALLMDTSVTTMSAMFGVFKAGGVLVMLSGMVTPESQEMMLRDAGARLFIVSAALRNSAEGYAGGLEGLMEGGRLAEGFEADGWHSLEALTAGASEEEPGVAIGYDDEAIIVYSSGTTGTPKGSVHSHFARYHLAYGFAIGYRMNPGTRNIVTTPLYSAGSWMTILPTFAVGGTVILQPAFSPHGFLELVQQERATFSFMVPTMFIGILAEPDFGGTDLSSLEVLVSAGSPLRLETKQEILERFGCALVETYGASEGISTMMGPEEMEGKIGSVGKPTLGGDIRIIGDDGAVLPAGEVGEVVGYGGGLMRRYHNRPGETEAAMWRDAAGRTYFRTGDIGRLDQDGCLFILDRKKDMIISGGLNIYASDVEQVLGRHPDVMDVAVIALPHDKWGETPLALVIPKEGAAVTEQALAEWANGRLGKYQRVSGVTFRRDFPRNALGKVLKRQLREEYGYVK